MSAMQQAVMPLVGPMLQGNGSILKRDSQALVANWVLKTCLVQHLSDGRKNWRKWASEYTRFFDCKLPTSHYVISIGAYTGEWATVFHFQPLLSTTEYNDGRAESVEGYIATIAVGHFVGQAVYLPSDDLTVTPPPFLRTVWPYFTDIVWRTGIYTGLELERLARTDLPPVDAQQSPQTVWHSDLPPRDQRAK
jgi:hypothetical protein